VVSVLARARGLEVVCSYLVAASIALLALHELTVRLAETPALATAQRA
jgi:hypothetical protein